MEIALGLLIPFVGTTLGSFMVFFMKNKISVRMENFLAGFASGVMISATMWSLLLPACEMAESSGVPIFIPTCIGFLMGASLFLLLDKRIPCLFLPIVRTLHQYGPKHSFHWPNRRVCRTCRMLLCLHYRLEESKSFFHQVQAACPNAMSRQVLPLP